MDSCMVCKNDIVSIVLCVFTYHAAPESAVAGSSPVPEPSPIPIPSEFMSSKNYLCRYDNHVIIM